MNILHYTTAPHHLDLMTTRDLGVICCIDGKPARCVMIKDGVLEDQLWEYTRNNCVTLTVDELADCQSDRVQWHQPLIRASTNGDEIGNVVCLKCNTKLS